MVRLLRCLVLAQSTPKLHHKEAKRRFIVSIAVLTYPLAGSKQLCALPHLGSTRAMGIFL